MRPFRRLFRLQQHPRDLGRAVDDELRFHLDMTIRELVAAGATEEAARAEALRRFGDVRAARDRLTRIDRAYARRLRAADTLESAWQDARYAARGLRLHPGFAAVAVLTLALGIGVNATIFGIIDQLFFRPPAHVRDPERIAMLSMLQRGETGVGQQTFNYPVYRTLATDLRSAESVAIASFRAEPLSLGSGLQARNVRGMLVSASYFTMLGAGAERGRFFSAEEDAEPAGVPVAVISDGFWRRQFGRDPQVLGKALDIGMQRYTIIGIAPPEFTGTELGRVDVWLPFTAAMARRSASPSWRSNPLPSYAHIFVKVRPGIPLSQLASDVGRAMQEHYAELWFVSGRHVHLTPLRTARSVNLGTNTTITVLLGAMATLVLLITCANCANLLLARALRRRREIAVRLALGVSRARLVRLLVAESVLLALLGGSGALLVAYWSGTVVRLLLFGDVPWVRGSVDTRVLIFTAAAALAVGVAAGLVPALQTSRPRLTDDLKSGAREGGAPRAATRSALLVVQAALALVLLAGAGLFVRSLHNVDALRMGVQPERVLYGTMDLRVTGRSAREGDAIFRDALARVRALPGIAHAAVALTIPFGPSYGADVHVEGRDSLPPGEGPFLNLVGPDYFAAIGARLVAGRDFTDADDRPESPPVVIVSRTMARRVWPGQSALGRCLRLGGAAAPCAQVVGVAEDVRRQEILEDPLYFVYVPLGRAAPELGERLRDRYIVAYAAADAARMIEPVRRAMQTVVPGLPYATVQRIAEMPDVLTQLRRWRLGANLFSAFGLLALLLASVGLFGLISYSVTQRVHEMGVRLTLGAPRWSLGTLVVGQALAVSVLGVAIGLAAALAGGRIVASQLYGVSPHDPLVLAGACLTLLIMAVIASVLPAVRAIRVDPLVALRAE